MSDENRKILILTPTKQGRVHDKKLADKFSIFHTIPAEVTAWVDSGFGFQGPQKIHSKTMIPQKKSKSDPWTPQQKEENRMLSSIRMTVENALCGIKHYNTLKQPFTARTIRLC